MKMILASGSPRRRELMEMLGFEDIEIIPAKGEENAGGITEPGRLVEALSAAKAQEVAGKFSGDELVIGADTVVWLDGKVLGKPRSREEAAEMLRALSGREHQVYTGVSLVRQGRLTSEHEVSRVFFRELTEDEIEAYIATGEPMDKAGAYGAQGLGALFVSRIDGDFFNVMGLPVCRLGEMLREQGVRIL